MRRRFHSGHLLVTAAVVLFASWPVAAQSGRTAGVSSAQVIRMPASRVRALQEANATAGQSVDTQVLGSFPAPGLGFDYTHQAAVNRNLATRALIDPLTQHRLALERQSRRNVVGVPIAMPVVVNNIQVIVTPPPPVVILPVEDEVQDEFAPRMRRASASTRPRYVEPEEPDEVGRELVAPAPPPAAPREVSDLVLIHRDGSLTFAVAYVIRGDRLTYITRDGHRRSLELALLDLDATRDMNESLGTTVFRAP